MDQYAGSLDQSSYCYIAAAFINFLHYCSPSSGQYGAGKDNRGRHTINLDTTPTTIIPPFLRQTPFLP